MIDKFLIDFFTNEVVVTIIAAVVITQILKVIIDSIRKGKFALDEIFATGGMPSSHSSVVAALTISVFAVEGVSTLSVVVLAFAGIVIRDAMGLRNQSGLHAKVLNKIIRDLKLGKKLKVTHLNEFLGHTPTQVLAGTILGIIISITVHVWGLRCGCFL